MNERSQSGKRETFQKYWVLSVLVIINCIVFLVMEIMGDTEDTLFLIEHGASYPLGIKEHGEYWRLFTSMFLHAGLIHLVNNMIMLIAAGQFLEKALGHFKFLVLYLLSGLAGSYLSYIHFLRVNEGVASVGASGAIFGVVGALLWVVIRNKGHYESLSTRGMVFLIAFSIYCGFYSNRISPAEPFAKAENIDNWGHIGGVIGGFVLAIFLYRRNRQKY